MTMAAGRWHQFIETSAFCRSAVPMNSATADTINQRSSPPGPSEIHPTRIGPRIWPNANATVNTLIADDQGSCGKIVPHQHRRRRNGRKQDCAESNAEDEHDRHRRSQCRQDGDGTRDRVERRHRRWRSAPRSAVHGMLRCKETRDRQCSSQRAASNVFDGNGSPSAFPRW